MIQTEVIFPSIPLRPYIQHYWVLKTVRTGMSSIILPVGCLKWMFHRKRPFDVNGKVGSGMKASIVGIYDKAIQIDSSEDVEMLTVFFQPYAAKIIMNIPSQEFFNDNVDLDSLGNAAFKELKARVLDADTTDECIDMIEEFLLRQITQNQASPYLLPLTKSFELLTSNPEARIEHLANAACLGERQFRRIFTDHVGVSPKQLQRTQRFHLATNDIIRTNGGNIEDIVIKYGYTDYSHFNKDFHDIAGLSPTEYQTFMSKIKRNGTMPAFRSYHTKK